MATKTKTVNLTSIPPVPVLRLALVGKVDGRESEMVKRLDLSSGQKLSSLAIIARDLSLKQCFFCGTDSHPQMKKAADIDWNLLPLCACLSSMRKGYREYHPNWRQQVQMIALKVDAKELDPNQPIYSDTCSKPGCGKTFTITAVKIANSIRKWGRHEQAHRCKACVDEARAQAHKKDTKKVSQPGVQPNKQGKKHKKQSQPSLTATLAEQLKAKVEEAQAAMAALNAETAVG